MTDNTLCVDMTDLQADRRSAVVVRGVTYIPAAPTAFMYCPPLLQPHGEDARNLPPTQWHPWVINDSAERERALTAITHPTVVWMALNLKMRQRWLETGCVHPKGQNAARTPVESVGLNPDDDPFFHATYDRMVAYRYAHGRPPNGGGIVLMLDLEAIKDSVGTDNVLDLSTSGGRAASGFKENHRAALFARKDLEVLIRAGSLSKHAGHILTALDIAILKFPSVPISINEGMLLPNIQGLRLHNAAIALAFESTKTYKDKLQRPLLCPRECMILSIDGSRQSGTTSPEQLDTPKTSMQPAQTLTDRSPPLAIMPPASPETIDDHFRRLAVGLVGERGSGNLFWLFWPREEANEFDDDVPDPWTGNWVLMHGTLPKPSTSCNWVEATSVSPTDALAPAGLWIQVVENMHRRLPLDDQEAAWGEPPGLTTAAPVPPEHEQGSLEWHHYVRCETRIYKPAMTGKELCNVTCRLVVFESLGTNIGWGQDLDAVTLENIKTLHNDKTDVHVQSHAIQLSQRMTGAWDLTKHIVVPATDTSTECYILQTSNTEGQQTLTVNAPPVDMHDATAYLFRNLAYAAHSLQKLPLRRQKEVRQALRNRGITQEILPEVAASLRDSLQGQQAGSWLHETVLQWHPDLRRYVHGRLSQFTEETVHSTGGQYTLQYSGQTLQRHSGTSGRKRRSTGRSLLATTIPAVEAAALIWGSQAPKTLTPLLNGTTWWLATVMGSKHASAIQQLLGTQDGAGKTVCACFWTRDAKKCCLSQPHKHALAATGLSIEPRSSQ